VRIKYGRLIDTEATLKSVTSDLEGNVLLTFDVKGSSAVITMKPSEALGIETALHNLDVKALSKVYG